MEAKIQSPTLEQSTIVERVARIVSSVRGAKSNYAHLASELEPAIPFDILGIALLRYDRQAVRVTVCKRKGNSWIAHYHQHPLADSMVERILNMQLPSSPGDFDQAGKSPTELIIHKYPAGLDGSPAQCGDALSGCPHLRATLIAPLVVADRILGTFELGSTRINAYDDETLQRLIRAVARVLAAAIESAQVGGSVEIQDRQRQELKDVSSALTSEMDLSGILNRIVVGIAKALNGASAIVTCERQAGTLRLQAQSGLDKTVLEAVIEQEVASSERSILGYALLNGQPSVSQNIAEDGRFPLSSAFASELQIHSMFACPLVIGSTVYGVLLLCSPEPGGFTPLKADILSLFASQASIAIHHDILLKSASKRRQFQEAIERLESYLRNNIRLAEPEGEQALLQQVRQESERTFGLRFSSLLRIISDNMLTSGERNILNNVGVFPLAEGLSEATAWGQYYRDAGNEDRRFQVERVAILTEVEAALARIGLLGGGGARPGDAGDTLDSSQARAQDPSLSQFNEAVTGYVIEPLFVVDLAGRCMYVTPTAEAFCNRQLSAPTNSLVDSVARVLRPASSISLQEAFAILLPRIRNAGEVLEYLQAFALEAPAVGDDLIHMQSDGNHHNRNITPDVWASNMLRCVIAAEPIQQETAAHFEALDDQTAPTETLPLLDEPGDLERVSQRPLQNGAPTDRHYQFKRYPLYDEHSRLIAYALQVQDITEQVRDEKNRSALLSAVSHELRTPLTTIKAAVTGLMQPGIEFDEAMLHEILEEIDSQTDYLDGLVNSLIEMSRIRMGALILDKEWCDVREIVHVTLSRMGHILDGRAVRTLFQPQLPLIQADYVQLGRVFGNLIENAVRHSPPGSEIVISLDMVTYHDLLDAGVPLDEVGAGNALKISQRSMISGDRAFLRAQVIDHGSGVPDGERERIFKPFYSLYPKNSGLGLAICRGIVEAHQGRIWIEQMPGGGSCFVFVLPNISS